VKSSQKVQELLNKRACICVCFCELIDIQSNAVTHTHTHNNNTHAINNKFQQSGAFPFWGETNNLSFESQTLSRGPCHNRRSCCCISSLHSANCL